jgi:5-methylcytosine-specific restriction endonuclease McrA
MLQSKHFSSMLSRIQANRQTPPEPDPPSEKETSHKKKQKIPSKVRYDVWATYIGPHIAEHKCICCKRVTIKQSDFEVGHVQSEANGGTLEINNLRPICSVCNKSMNSRNMIDYVKQYGYYI